MSTLGVDTHLKEGLGWEPVDQLYQLFPDHNGRTNALRATKNKVAVLNGVCDHCAGAGYYGYEGGWMDGGYCPP